MSIKRRVNKNTSCCYYTTTTKTDMLMGMRKFVTLDMLYNIYFCLIIYCCHSFVVIKKKGTPLFFSPKLKFCNTNLNFHTPKKRYKKWNFIILFFTKIEWNFYNFHLIIIFFERYSNFPSNIKFFLRF